MEAQYFVGDKTPICDSNQVANQIERSTLTGLFIGL